MKPDKDTYRLGDLQKISKPLIHNQAASVWMLEDHSFNQNILCVEFHTKANALNGLAMEILYEAVELTDKHKADGLVVYNEAMNFSAGADLNTLIELADDENWQGIDLYLSFFQDSMMKLRYSNVPVIAAPHGLTLGGGCEVTMHCDKAVVYAETYMGLVEVGAGLIPGGGGCKEMALRAQDQFLN